jgi:hydrogenase expression/formation protein HypE
MVAELLACVGDGVHALRDPTRGGVATTIKEVALQSQVAMTLHEEALPLSPGVRGVCAILGLDPLYVANEGKLLVFVAPARAEAALALLQSHPFGRQAALIGEVTDSDPGTVQMRTAAGGLRRVEMLAGEQLPRIC